MKQILFALFLLVGTASAQDMTSGNLIGPHNLTGTTPTDSQGGGYSGGNVPGYNSATNTILFGYTQSTAAYNYAVSQALRDSGLVFSGYNYSWEYYNQNDAAGSLSANVNFIGLDGSALYSKNWTLGTTNNGWTSMSGTETFNSIIPTAALSSFGLSFTGNDNRFWAGYYGPQVRNPSLSVNYRYDACMTNPLSSPSCPGYEAAYLQQQCSINPLHSPSCPGYQQAFYNQQCSINALYDSGCPGYAQAYFDQQCHINGLYSRDCPNYAQAYAAKNLVNKKEDAQVAEVRAVPDPVSSTAPTQTTSTTSPTSVTSVVAPKTETAAAPAAKPDAKADAKPEAKSENKPEARPQSQAQREKAKKEATESAKNLATAKSLEAQQAAQGSIVAAMGTIVGFDVYETSRLPDVVFYRQREIYANQTPVDNRNAQRYLNGASDILHQLMIEQQYQIGK